MTNGYISSRLAFDDFNTDDWALDKKQTEDTGFQQFLGNKYPTTNQVTFDQFNADEIEVPTQLQQDQEEYDKKVKSFGEVSMVTGSIPNTHLTLAWNLRKIDNKRAKAGMDALSKGVTDTSYINRQYQKDLADLSKKYGYTPEEIEEWQSRDWRGFLTGLTECLVDMKDVYVKAGAAAAGEVALGAGAGAAIGSVVPGVGTGLGATAGAAKGIVAAKYTAIPAATFQDTYDKEAGSFYLSELSKKSNWTPEELKKLQATARLVGATNATIEAGVAAVALPYVIKY